MKNEDLEDHKLNRVQRWVRVIIEGSETYGLEDIVIFFVGIYCKLITD